MLWQCYDINLKLQLIKNTANDRRAASCFFDFASVFFNFNFVSFFRCAHLPVVLDTALVLRRVFAGVNTLRLPAVLVCRNNMSQQSVVVAV